MVSHIWKIPTQWPPPPWSCPRKNSTAWLVRSKIEWCPEPRAPACRCTPDSFGPAVGYVRRRNDLASPRELLHEVRAGSRPRIVRCRWRIPANGKGIAWQWRRLDSLDLHRKLLRKHSGSASILNTHNEPGVSFLLNATKELVPPVPWENPEMTVPAHTPHIPRDTQPVQRMMGITPSVNVV